MEKPGKRMRSNDKVEDDDGSSSRATGMELLPPDILVDILSRLPINSLMQFKFVCRAWNSLAHDPLLLQTQLSSKPSRNPCLILHCDSPLRTQLYFVDLSVPDYHDEKVKRFNTPFQAAMPEFNVVGSCYGLLCLSDLFFNDPIYIYNPFTSDYIKLPESANYHDQEVVFGFGFHPVTKQYKVVKIVYYRNGHQRSRRVFYPQSEVQIFTLGTSAWRTLGKVPHRLVRSPSEALINGRLHWVTRPRRYHPARRIISFDLADEQFREVPKPDSGGLNRCNFHPAVIRECLAAAVYGSYGKMEVWVMKEYNVKESWMKQFSIGAYMPKRLKQNLERPFKNWKNAVKGSPVRILCELENSEILLEYKNRVVVSYDPNRDKFRDVMFQGIPSFFSSVVHVAGFNWIDKSGDASCAET